MDSTTDLIVAPATAPLPAARSIVRFAGDGLSGILRCLFCSADGSPLQLPNLQQPAQLIDVTLNPKSLGSVWGELPLAVLFWPGPEGPLGAAVAEVQLPGSAPLQAAFVHEACRLGARLARGGEFSLRSFLAGKIDLLQAEAVVAVIDARTPQELSQALDHMAGGVGRSVEELREYLLDLVADIEAAIDFSDDLAPDSVPVPDTTQDAIAPKIRHVCQQLDQVTHHLAGRDSGGQGVLPRVVLAGAPNIGKSSLFNHLVGRDAALVENASGTTRDWIAGEFRDSAGIVSCLLVDLAGISGLHESGDCLVAEREVSAAADRVAREEIQRADVIVACHDIDSDPLTEVANSTTAECIHVITRVDQQPEKKMADSEEWIPTSVKAGIGIEKLRQRILEMVSSVDRATPATIRLRVGLESARESLVQAEKSMAGCDGLPPDEALLAVLLRHAIDALGEATGAVVGTDILDRVFSRHCIGK